MSVHPEAVPATWFSPLCELVVARLAFGLNSVVAPKVLGFGLLNSFTFAVDLMLLTAFHGALGLPLAVRPQFAVYVAVVVANYLALVLGVCRLAAVGVEYHAARIIAGACEAVYIYSAMRWVVFRR